MGSHLQVWGPNGVAYFPLEGEQATVGTSPSNDVVISWDKTVSRLHAVFERFAAGMSVRDLGSRNGTAVNGERIIGDRVLHPGDEVRVGNTRLVYRADAAINPELGGTETAEAAPGLTHRERDVLVALCRPVFSGELLSEPASVRQIANELVLTESAVKKHLLRLYDKFGIAEETERRRGRLANEAIRRGAITLADVRDRSRGG